MHDQREKMGVAGSRKRPKSRPQPTYKPEPGSELSFCESTDSGTSDSDGEWDNLPPFPSTGTRNCHYLLRLLLVGACDTGKTKLLERFTEDFFHHPYIATIGVDFKIRTVMIDERKFKLQLWDTAGHERFRTITRAYYKGSTGIFIVYNARDEASFDALPKWIEDVKQYAMPDVKLTILGNKCDLKKGDKGVDFCEAKKLSDEYGIPLFEVSAKDGTNVELAITHMVGRIWKTMVAKADL